MSVNACKPGACYRKIVMKHKVLFLSFCCLLLLAPVIRAQPAPYPRMGFGARGLAMSNALIADAFGDGSPYYNPSLAPFTAGQNLEATVALLSLDRQLQFLQLATPLRPRAGIAAGVIHAGVTGIDGRNNSGYHTEDYSVDEFTFFLAFGTKLADRVSAGVGLQLFRADYLDEMDSPVTIGIDIGLNARITDDLYVGAAVEDLLARYKWNTGGLYGEGRGNSVVDDFPVRLRLGSSYRLLDGRAFLHAEYESIVYAGEHRRSSTEIVGDQPATVTETESFQLQSNRLRFGAEYRLAESFALRGGIDRIFSEAVRPTTGFFVEQPIGKLVTRIEYAFAVEPFDAGSLHFVTLRLLL